MGFTTVTIIRGIVVDTKALMEACMKRGLYQVSEEEGEEGIINYEFIQWLASIPRTGFKVCMFPTLVSTQAGN